MLALIGRLFGGVLSAISKNLGAILGFALGQTLASKRAARKSARIKDAQLSISVRPDRDRDDILDRMRDRDL